MTAEPVVGLSVGTEYTIGEYGGDRSVDELYVPVTGTLDLNRVALRLTVPFLSVRAPELTYTEGPEGQPIVGDGSTVTESGLGDVIASITVLDVLGGEGGPLAMDLTGKIKFGTADADKGLGTGEQDYSIQADVFRFCPRFTAIGTVGYSLRGCTRSCAVPCTRRTRRQFAGLGRGALVRRVALTLARARAS